MCIRDSPNTGGIRLVVSWTDEGRAKKGKSLKRFSPSFDLSEPDGDGICNVTGTSANMGCLVNRAAFRAIQSLSASAPAGGGPENTKTETTTMTDEEIKALQMCIRDRSYKTTLSSSQFPARPKPPGRVGDCF